MEPTGREGELTGDEDSRSILAAHLLLRDRISPLCLTELRSRSICSVGVRQRYRGDDDLHDAGAASSSPSLETGDLAQKRPHCSGGETPPPPPIDLAPACLLRGRDACVVRVPLVQYVVPWYNTCLHGHAMSIRSVTGHRDIFLLAHEHTDESTNVFVGSINTPSVLVYITQ